MKQGFDAKKYLEQQSKYILKINRDDFINILIKYRIPIARETINEINKYNIFLLEK